ncbi:MAG: hypothetical protein HYU64_05765 [Armatimonadetes bacterium]|nr:hypothetical protein [Armatimonadota bacterium]
MKFHSGFLILLLAISMIFLTPHPAQAFPHYSRKYKMPCWKCHQMNFPKLNADGEKFASLGKRFPVDIKDRKEYPFKFAEATTFMTRLQNSARQTNTANTSALAIHSVQVFSTSSLGRNLAYHLEYYFYEEGNPLWAEAFLQYNSTGSNRYFSVKVGQFEPLLWTKQGLSNRISISRPDVMNTRVGNGNSYRIRDRQRGVELAGYSGPWTLAASVVDGAGPNVLDSNNQRDLILQGYYAFPKGQGSSIGAYYYKGIGTARPSKKPTFEDDFYRLGLVGNYTKDSYEIDGGAFYGRNQTVTGSVQPSFGYFAALEKDFGDHYVGFARYDHFDPDKSKSDDETQGWTLGIDKMVLTNMKLTGEARWRRVGTNPENSTVLQLLMVF